MKHRILFAFLFAASSAHAQPAPDPAAGTSSGTEAPPSTEPPVEKPAEPEAAPLPPPAPAPTSTIDEKALNALIDERIAKSPKTAGWKDGFFIRTVDDSAKLRIGGIMQFDGRFFVDDTQDPHINQFAFRSIRPDLQGTVLDHYEFRLLPDFAGGKIVVQDAYADVHYGDAVKFRVGKFKVPFGLERLQNEIATTFTERGLPTQLAPNRDLGVQVFGDIGLLTYQLGVFNGVADGGSGDGDVSNGKDVAARVFVKPVAGLGLGVAGTFGDKTGTVAQPDTPQWKTSGQTTIFQYKTGGTSLMDTVIADGRHWRGTAQGYYYAGPIGLLAEYVRSGQHVSLQSTHELVVADAWQVLGQWVVTGDDATYNSVTPRHPFDPEKGHWGAVDVVARVGELRLTDGVAFDTGLADPTKYAFRAWSAGGGTDWFVNKVFRVVLDVERTWYTLGAKDGNRPPETSIIGRAQTVF